MPAQTRHSSQRPPAYRLHKARGTAVATIAGRNHYLGPYGSSESYEKYARLIAEWKATGSRAAVPPVGQSRQGGDVTVVELVAIYWTHCRQYYRKDGKPTDHLHVVKQALRTLKDCYGREPAERVGPLALRAVQQRLIEAARQCTETNRMVILPLNGLT